MSPTLVRANLLMLLCAAIWGFAFVAQIEGMRHLKPFSFNGIRFIIGAMVILPLYFFTQRSASKKTVDQSKSSSFHRWGWSICAGGILFSGAALQQIGLQTTTAGNAGFITGFYVVLTPIAGLFLQQKPGIYSLIGAGIALIGLYFLSVNAHFHVREGDWFELIGALFWTAHVLFIGHFVKNIPPLLLAGIQFLTTGLLSLFCAIIWEGFRFNALQGMHIEASLPSLLFAGVLSTAVAYTLQVVGQQYAHPAHAAIILSTESVFAAIAGYLLLNEIITMRMFFGGALMLTGMIVSQMHLFKISPKIIQNNASSI
jgi:drug/metabolite transporter (DMT)-like permease